MIKKYKNTFILILVFLIATGAYFLFIQTPYFKTVEIWARANIFFYVSFLVVMKIVGIIIPPIPGGLFTLASIPIIGWQYAFVGDFVGSTIGSSIAFFIGKKYGYSLINSLFDAKTVEKFKKIKIKKNKEIEAIFMLRVLMGSTIAEIVCYGAGIIGVTFKNFFIGSILYGLILGLPLYFLAQNLFDSKNALFSLILFALSILFIWKFKGRYFE
jgi:uncharacterized membrane protein YdjX (TVP38/TMEM64 family)